MLPGRQAADSAISGWQPVLQQAQQARPSDPDALREALRKQVGKAESWTVEQGWKTGTVREERVKTDRWNMLLRRHENGGRKLCIAAVGPDGISGGADWQGWDVIEVLCFAGAQAFAKTQAGYDELTGVCNASLVLGDSIAGICARQLAALIEKEREKGYEEITLIGQGPMTLAALLAGALSEQVARTLIVKGPTSLDEMFSHSYNLLNEAMILPGLLRLADLPDLARLNRSVKWVEPVRHDGTPDGPEDIQEWGEGLEWLKRETI